MTNRRGKAYVCFQGSVCNAEGEPLWMTASEFVVPQAPTVTRSAPRVRRSDLDAFPSALDFIELRDEHGRNLSTLLGSILRIDVGALDERGGYAIPHDNPFASTPGARAEIWSYGFRNPWRFSFDAGTDELWVADVGQNAYEEVDLVRRGANYGWNVMEGLHCFPRGDDCDTSGHEPPVAEYGRDGGCSITGGYVYRGGRVPSLFGAYVYGDFCSGRLWALRHDGERVIEGVSLADTTLRISSFGVDHKNELYVLSIDGRLLRFVPGASN